MPCRFEMGDDFGDGRRLVRPRHDGTICSTPWTRPARLRCRPTSPPRWPIPSATRRSRGPSGVGRGADGRVHLTPAVLDGIDGPAGHRCTRSSWSSDSTRSGRSRSTGSRTTTSTPRPSAFPPRRGRRCSRRGAAGAGSWRSGPPRCVPSSRRPGGRRIERCPSRANRPVHHPGVRVRRRRRDDDELPSAPVVAPGTRPGLRRTTLADLYAEAMAEGYRFLSFGDAMLSCIGTTRPAGSAGMRLTIDIEATDGAARTGRSPPRGDRSRPRRSCRWDPGLDPRPDRRTNWPRCAAADGSAPEILLANTYHLMLRPGADVVAGPGRAASFSGWHRLHLTDSGGFQVFSLAPAGDRRGRDVPLHLRRLPPTSSPRRGRSPSRSRSAPTSRWCSTCAPNSRRTGRP